LQKAFKHRRGHRFTRQGKTGRHRIRCSESGMGKRFWRTGREKHDDREDPRQVGCEETEKYSCRARAKINVSRRWSSVGEKKNHQTKDDGSSWTLPGKRKERGDRVEEASGLATWGGCDRSADSGQVTDRAFSFGGGAILIRCLWQEKI